MRIKQFVVDAFANQVFQGNPAAVCPLEEWLDEGILQAIAAENNLSETAFFVATNSGYDLRWFTPLCEVDLCGHATLAAAHVIFNHLDARKDKICFLTRSGELIVERQRDRLEMLFPASRPVPCKLPAELASALGGPIQECHSAEDYLVVYPAEQDIQTLQPDMALLKKLGLRGVIATAPGNTSDFVSRFFAPGVGIDEDPVTGSAHCQLIPYWSERLGKADLHALQISKRRGELFCKMEGNKVRIAGRAITFLQGEIEF